MTDFETMQRLLQNTEMADGLILDITNCTNCKIITIYDDYYPNELTFNFSADGKLLNIRQ